MLFKPQQIVVTAGAALALQESGIDPEYFVEMHACGEWGDISESEWARNEQALRTGGPLMSSYETPQGQRIGVITPADRSVTVVTEFPQEC